MEPIPYTQPFFNIVIIDSVLADRMVTRVQWRRLSHWCRKVQRIVRKQVRPPLILIDDIGCRIIQTGSEVNDERYTTQRNDNRSRKG